MKNKKIAATSREAYESLNPVKVHQTHINIVKALESLGSGNYEAIAARMEVPEQRVWKRLSECVRSNLIHNTGTTTLTKNGCKSYVFAPGPPTEPVKKKERVMKGKTISDYSKALNQAKQSPITIERLF